MNEAQLPKIAVHEGVASPGTDRTLAILELLGRHRKGLQVSEIARELSLPVNSVTRIVETMLHRGWLYRREDARRHVLTNRVADLTRPQVNDKSLSVCAWESLKWLRDETGETAQLLVMSNQKATVLEQCASDQAIKVSGKVGHRVPMYSCAPGKAILAALPADELEGYLDAVQLKAFTRHTLATREALTADLETIRERGYALDMEEGIEGIRCVAAVILDEYHYPVAGMTVIGPVFRLDESQLKGMGTCCVKAAQQVHERLIK